MYLRSKKITAFLLAILLIYCSGCRKNSLDIPSYYSENDIVDVINSAEMLSQPLLSEIQLDKFSAEEFLFDNHCFSFYRDMDYFLGYSVRYDYISSIISEYPPQIVRTIENNGQKSMYFIYETDDGTRVFVFFFESDNFQYTRGYPIVMKKSLSMDEFSTFNIGDSIDDVEAVDPIAALYRKGYDTLSDDLVYQLYVGGREKISTIHLLTDGIVRIDYSRNKDGIYVIEHISRADDYTISVLGGKLCYLIYPEDYLT